MFKHLISLFDKKYFPWLYLYGKYKEAWKQVDSAQEHSQREVAYLDYMYEHNNFEGWEDQCIRTISSHMNFDDAFNLVKAYKRLLELQEEKENQHV